MQLKLQIEYYNYSKEKGGEQEGGGYQKRPKFKHSGEHRQNKPVSYLITD
jgi:hypothetical protein